MTIGSSALNGTPISTRALSKVQELSQMRLSESMSEDGNVCCEAGPRDTHDRSARVLTTAVGTCTGPFQ